MPTRCCSHAPESRSGVAATKTFVAQVVLLYALALRLASLTESPVARAAARSCSRSCGTATRADQPCVALGRRERSRARRELAWSPFFLYLGRLSGLPGGARGRAEAEGDLLRPDRRVRGRGDEARADRAAQRRHSCHLRCDRGERAAEAALQPLRGSRPRRPRARGRERRMPRRSPSTPSTSSTSRGPTRCSRSPLAIVPLQLFAYHLARARGLNVDQPRNLAKTVTVE